MKDKDFKDLNRRELVELVYNIMDEDEEGKEKLVDLEEVRQERVVLDNRARFKKILLSTLAVLTVVAAIAVLISMLFLPVIQVSGDSMQPNLSDGDIILLVKTKKFSAGDICCVSWQNKLLLKRVIGLPGDSISIDAEGNVFVNGEMIDEPYVKNKCLGECDIEFPYIVPDNKLFIMGDRRDTSVDSRSSVIGCVDYDQMVGKKLFRVWSS